MEETIGSGRTLKAAYISLNTRIILKGHNIRSKETGFLRQWIMEKYGYEVDFISTKKKRMKDDDPENVSWYKDSKEVHLNTDYDVVFVHNSTANFIGGNVQAHTVKLTKEICYFDGPVYYMYTDPNLHLQNFAYLLYDRDQKGIKTNYNSDLRIEEKEVELFKNAAWNILWCGEDFDSYYTHSYLKMKPERRCNFQAVENYDPMLYMFLREDDLPTSHVPFENRLFDLVYYGNWRPARKNKLEQYFKNTLPTIMVGIDKEVKDWINVKASSKYVERDKLYTHVQLALASVVIGDPDHNNNIKTARFFENIKFELCSFIDLSYDPNKELYKDPFLKSYMYVENRYDLVGKVTQIRQDRKLFNKIIELQKKELNEIY